MHDQVMDFVRRCVPRDHDAVLEIGSCDVNGGVRALFEAAAHYWGIDVVDGPGVDERADAADWTPPRRYDVVVTTEVLEHAPRWRAVLDTAWRALEPGGRLIMTCATDPRPPHSAVDGWAVRAGEHYGNVDADEVRAWLDAVDCDAWSLEVATDRGDLYLSAQRRGPRLG